MHGVVSGLGFLTEKQRRTLDDVVSGVLRDSPPPSAARGQALIEQFDEYVGKTLPGAARALSDAEFNLSVELIRWHLRVALRLPELTAAEQARLRTEKEILDASIDPAIKRVFSSLPETVRSSVRGGVEKRWPEIRKQVGSYFYESYLYPPADLSVDQVVDELARCSSLSSQVARYGEIAKTMQDETLGAESRRGTLESYERYLAEEFDIAISDLLRKKFVIPDAAFRVVQNESFDRVKKAEAEHEKASREAWEAQERIRSKQAAERERPVSVAPHKSGIFRDERAMAWQAKLCRATALLMWT